MSCLCEMCFEHQISGKLTRIRGWSVCIKRVKNIRQKESKREQEDALSVKHVAWQQAVCAPFFYEIVEKFAKSRFAKHSFVTGHVFTYHYLTTFDNCAHAFAWFLV